MGSIIDKIGDFFQSAFDSLVDIVEDIWNEIVAPIAEEIFSWLGFEDETIINTYVVVSSLYGDQTYVNPFKKIPINRITFETEVYDEIINIFISGEHVRIKFYMRKIEKYGRTPTSSIQVSTIPEQEVIDIIEAEVTFEPITIVNIRVRFPDVIGYIRNYLQDNQATTGYIFDSRTDKLTDENTFEVFYIDDNIRWEYDPVDNNYDLLLLGNINYTISGGNAINALPAVIPNDGTYYRSLIDTAVNMLSAPSSTYNVVIAAEITVTVDTAIDDHTAAPAATAGVTGVVEVAVDDHVAAQDPGYPYDLDTTEFVFEGFIPPQTSPQKRFEALYTIDSETDEPLKKYWWFYELEEEGSRTYPQLYPSDPTVGFPTGSKQTPLPIVPLKLDSQWLIDRPKSDQDRKEVNRSMRRYGLNMNQISRTLKKDPNGNDDDLNSVFILFGINVGKATSNSELAYLFFMLRDYATYSPDLNVTEYTDKKRDFEFISEMLEGRTYHRVTKGNDNAFWSLSYNPDPERCLDLLEANLDVQFGVYRDEVIADPGGRHGEEFRFQYDPTSPDVMAPHLDELKEVLASNMKNNQTSFTIVEGDYNITISYAFAEITQFAGVIGDGEEDNMEKQIVAQDYQLYLRRQIAPNLIEQVWLLDFTGFSYLQKDGFSVFLTSLDFIGSDVEGVNVKNNMVVPVTYGYLPELGIVKRKEALYRAAYICMFAVDVTKLRWYETAAFAKFFGFILKIIAIVILVVSFGSASGVSSVLWTAAQIYGSKIIAEYAIQQMLLANPDSKLALALALAVSLYAASLGDSSAFATTLDTVLTTLAAVNQVTNAYVEAQGVKLLEEHEEFLETAKEKDERLKQAIDNLDHSSEALLAYIKQTITMKFTDPSSFYDHHLTRNLVDQALDLEKFTDLEAFLDLDEITSKIKDS